VLAPGLNKELWHHGMEPALPFPAQRLLAEAVSIQQPGRQCALTSEMNPLLESLSPANRSRLSRRTCTVDMDFSQSHFISNLSADHISQTFVRSAKGYNDRNSISVNAALLLRIVQVQPLTSQARKRTVRQDWVGTRGDIYREGTASAPPPAAG